MKVVTGWISSLSASITSTQTTIPVVSIQTNDDTPTTIVAGLIDSVGYMVIEPNSVRTEIIKFTGITDNGDGSGSLTGVTRGLQFSGTQETLQSGNNKAHQAGSKIIMSNAHFYLDDLVDLSSDETISGTKTFSALPTTTAGDPTGDNQFARKAYVDATATGTTSINRTVVEAVAGETIAAGELVYYDTTAKEWLLCDADTATTVENVMLGIAQGAGTDGVAITGGVLTIGLDSNQSGMTAGDIMYASNTAGAIANSAGTKEVTVGIAYSATELYFSPRYNQQITEDEQDALAGSSGTPSGSNLFITADDVSDAGGSGKIIRASLTAIAPGIFVPVEQLEHTESSQGSLIYRNATEFTIITPGTTGKFLQTKGAGANPVWTEVATRTLAAISVNNVAQSFTSEILGGNYETLLSYTVPANTLGLNGIIRYKFCMTVTTSTAIRPSVYFGGTLINDGDQLANGDIVVITGTIANRNNASSQVGEMVHYENGTAAFVDTVGTGSKDTTSSQVLEIRLLNTSTDETPSIVVEYVHLELIKS